jgi:cell division septum initiation protein DivIVA
MDLERVISMGERLERLLDAAEKEAEEIVAEAERRANEMVSKAKSEAERRRNMAQRGSGIDELLREAEEKAKIEAEKSLECYREKAEALKKLPEEKMREAVALVLKEVLPE